MTSGPGGDNPDQQLCEGWVRICIDNTDSSDDNVVADVGASLLVPIIETFVGAMVAVVV